MFFLILITGVRRTINIETDCFVTLAMTLTIKMYLDGVGSVFYETGPKYLKSNNQTTVPKPYIPYLYTVEPIKQNQEIMNINIIPGIKNANSNQFFLLAGPCAIEGEAMALKIAEKAVKTTNELGIPYVFKGSYRKANRSRIDSFNGIGDEKALKILKKVSETFDIPTITDIHSAQEAAMAAEYVDILQIPAFLCRQTDILIAAAQTGKVVNIKKGQFLAPESMIFAINKVRDSGNSKVMVTDRGTTFGYQDLIVDYRGIPVMRNMGIPVVLDITHSLQQPNQTSGVTGGKPELIETIARAGIAVGCDGIFLETHFDPANAKSDGANMLHLDYFEKLLERLAAIRETVVKLDY
jgi:2-dehydro-3-deoxyphosphooctonate aldolase (KDO 8-P synthase)